jgi:hypothetical protein
MTWATFPLLFAGLAPEPDPLARALAPFPPPAVVQAELAFAEAHLGWLHSRAAFSPEEWGALEAARNEVARAKGAWEDLSTAQDPEGCLAARRWCLDQLREKLGPAAFARGEMPLPVAWGLMRRVD